MLPVLKVLGKISFLSVGSLLCIVCFIYTNALMFYICLFIYRYTPTYIIHNLQNKLLV